MVIGGDLVVLIPCSAWYWLGLSCCGAYISMTWKAGIKEKLGEVLLAIGPWYSPFKLRSNNQVWPENFGGVKKSPAVDLVSAVYMAVPEEDK
jgi:hypothetical protein